MATFKQIQARIQKISEEALQEVVDMYVRKWRDLVARSYEDNFRTNGHTPYNYGRTGDVWSSIGSFPIEIYGTSMSMTFGYDTSEISPAFEGGWNAHMSIYGEDVSKDMPYWIEKGTTSKIYSYEGIEAIDYLTEYIKRNYQRDIKRALQKRGLSIN